MATPFPTLRARDGFTGQNEHLRPQIEEYQRLVSAVSEFTLEVDGRYGHDGTEATRALQRRYGFEADGVVRPDFVAKLRRLKDHPEERIEPEGVTLGQLVAVVGEANRSHCVRHLDGLNAAMRTYGITTPLRQAHFLAQVAHESGGFKFSEEIWGPTKAQKKYEGRGDLGNTQAGDGFRFRGRGLIQLTGRANYRDYTAHCRDRGLHGDDFEEDPDRVGEPPHAAAAAGWFWDRRKVNRPADDDDVVRVTKLINGGKNGLPDRKKYLARAKAALGV